MGYTMIHTSYIYIYTSTLTDTRIPRPQPNSYESGSIPMNPGQSPCLRVNSYESGLFLVPDPFLPVFASSIVIII